MKVLVVEDEHKIANSIKKGLEQEKMAVDVAYEGRTGFDLASSEDYDVMVLDLMLPGMDGLTICKKLREEKVHTPILILTARGLVEDRVRGLNAGADDYLSKPFSFAELLARIRVLARRPRKSLGTILKVNDLSLDTESYVVKKGGRKIDLSKKEFALLEYLMRQEGKTVSKDQIINHVWDYEANVLPNTVEVFIGYLRKKIDKGIKGGDKLIQTVRGFGYKIGGNK
jgi:DNA-binding response OmpR family regulator